MNKQSISTVIACILSCNAYTGVYSGLNLGVNTVTVHKNLSYPLEESTPTSSSFNNAYTNFHGQIIAGYELPWSAKFSTALELDADLFTGKSRYKIDEWFFNEDVDAEEQLEYGFSFFLLPTYQYNESARFFVGPGISGSRFAVNMNNTAGNVGVSANFKKWLIGGGLKAGAITKLTNNLDLLLTYQFTQYNSTERTQIEPLSDETLQGRYRPNVNTVLIGLRVHMPELAAKTK
ncbi:outer membrane beta-barrel protein [Fluoribacter gormanii]|uniref:outer membrane beta-barrel protein n=1 Tax=Fluoribacter gormanii TaxID=464 RepID=UPI0010412ECD|nr:outer membrane beta-barrel protein [Fluoribacter gormanii]